MPNPDLPPVLQQTGFERLDFVRTRASQRALVHFGTVRTCVLLCVLLGAVTLSRDTSANSLFALGLCFLALGVGIELFARARLLRTLSSEAQRFGESRLSANSQAQAFLGRILHEHLPRLAQRRLFGLPPIVITRQDSERIHDLLSSTLASSEVELRALDDELARAEIVSARRVPSDVVTMHSRVCFADETGGTSEITLVYPSEADADTDRVSVLSPVGSALLGLRVGQVIEWAFPEGAQKRFRILAVPYQPEAARHFHL